MPDKGHRLLRGSENAGDGGGHAQPGCLLVVELAAAQRGQLVELRLPPGFRRRPLRSEPSALLETMEGRIERALLDLQHVAGDLLEPLGDGVAMDRSETHHFQDQQIERALQQIGLARVVGHAKAIYISICRMSTYWPAHDTPCGCKRDRPPARPHRPPGFVTNCCKLDPLSTTKTRC